MTNWRDKRDEYPHVGRMADAMDELKNLVESGIKPPLGFARLVKHIEPITAILDTYYQDEKICNLGTESIRLIVKAVTVGWVNADDEERVAAIADQLRELS